MRATALFLVAASLLLGGCAQTLLTVDRVESPYRDLSSLNKGDIVHLPTGRRLSEEELLEYLSSYRVVYVGETHDNVYDHQVELTILKGLAERFPGQVVLGLEMLRRPYQEKVDAYLAGELSEREFVRTAWSPSWGPNSWRYYRDILRFVRDEGIPVLALNAGRDLTRAASRAPNLDELDEDLRKRLPKDMDLADPYHRAFIRAIFGGHSEGTNRSEAFYRVQVIWDETMAETAARYLRSPEGRGKRLVVFAGGNHVRYGFGMPRRLFRRVPEAYVIVDPLTIEIPEEKQEKVLMDVNPPDLPLRPADVYWAVGYDDLEDERVMLGVRIEKAEGGGARVLGVMPDSPAAKAGIQEGDVIVSVDGEPVEELFDLTFQVGQHKPGDRGPVVVVRNGERRELQVEYDVVKHGGER
ncbi:MAG: PDZ domain-containing protein [Deltaproteobacteria bacterium]|nr:PDZ domain-containing protein [Deltaproteobacteria bacterium]